MGPIVREAEDDDPLIAAWNRRAEPPCPPDVERLVAVAREAHRHLSDLDDAARASGVTLVRADEHSLIVAQLRAALATFERPLNYSEIPNSSADRGNSSPPA